MSPSIANVDGLEQARKDDAVATVGLMALEDGRVVRSLEEIDQAQLRAGVRYQRIWEPLNGAVPFERWAAQKYGARTLAIGEASDPMDTHRRGCRRLDSTGRAIELIEREIPRTLGHVHFIRAAEAFLLKPGAIGWAVDDIDGPCVEVTEGLAGTAHLRDVDREEMRRRKRAEIEARWDAVQAATQGARWRPFAECEQRHPQGPTYRHEVHLRAVREWADQPAVRLALSTPGTYGATPRGLDPPLVPRDEYVAHHGRRAQAFDGSGVVEHWQYLDRPDEDEILAGLDDDALLVSVTVKC